MKIGFDLDKVFIDTPPFIPDRIIERLYKQSSTKELRYRIPGKFEKTIRYVSHAPIFRPVISENLSFLSKLAKRKNKLYLISSRFAFLKPRTDGIIKKHNLSEIFSGIYMNYENQQPHEFKSEVLKTLDLSIYVDDDLGLLQFLAKRIPHVKYFWLNKKIRKKISPSITAISTLWEIESKL